MLLEKLSDHIYERPIVRNDLETAEALEKVMQFLDDFDNSHEIN